MPIIRKQLKPSDVYPDDIRYNESTDTVQSLIDGVWTDNPAADPRTQNTFPPRITSDPKCDAAQSIVDALQNQIAQTIEAVENASTAATIAGLILGLLTFGVFEIFIAIALTIANAMLDAGSAALNAALTAPVYHTLVCILRCRMNPQGQLDENSLALVMSDVDIQIGGLGATVLKSMMALAGFGGLNNLAALGTSTGSCGDCGCTDCVETWQVWDGPTGTSPPNTYGIITEQEGNRVRVQFVSNWMSLCTSDVNICCKIADVVTISGGTVYRTAYNDCGVPFTGGAYQHPSDPTNHCCWIFEFQALGADRPLVDIFFDNCP